MLNRSIKNSSCFAILLALLFFSCGPTKKESTILSLKAVTGIKFIETRREFSNGLSFSEDGFQQVPEWTLCFLPGDSVKIYSPFEKKYIFYPVYYDHHDVVNFAREWLRIKHVSKDSLVLQLLQVRSRKIISELSQVYMRFYSDNYIRNTLHTNPDSLRKPDHRDTLFVKSKVKRANIYSQFPDSLFAARNAVQFKSLSSDITVEKVNKSEDSSRISSAEYLYPEYMIVINHAYKDFVSNFNAIVDAKGKITVTSFAVLDKDFEAPRRRVLQGIADVYLQRFLKIKPGSTLGHAHATEIMLHIKLIKG